MMHPVGTFYFPLHLFGILLVFSAYGMLIARGMLGSESKALRKFGAMASGLGLLAILISGFGMIARLDYPMTAPWLLIKMAVWVALGAMLALINRRPGLGQIWFWVTIVLGLVAVLSVYYRIGA